MTSLFVAALLAIVVIVVAHDRSTKGLLERCDDERNKQAVREARERWEIMTRLQAPALMASAPLAPPPVPLAEQDIVIPEEDPEVDHGDLIGTIVSG